MAAVVKEENNGFEGRRKQNSYFVPLRIPHLSYLVELLCAQKHQAART